MIELRIEAKRFGERSVLGAIGFALAPGSATALLGPSGIGKTTLLRILAGLDADFEGTRSAPERIGVVFQEPRLLPWLTALRNVELADDIGVERARRCLGLAGVADAADLYPRQLSLGMARRVSLARALSVEPDLLILDEPFASLDETSAAAMRHLVVAAIGTAKTTVLLVSHDPEEAVAMADRVLILSGRPATILADLTVGRSRAERDAKFLASLAADIRSRSAK